MRLPRLPPLCRGHRQRRGGDQSLRPGGENTILSLADLLGRDPVPLDESLAVKLPSVAVIDEKLCIGCTLCIQACPVDAILGAAKQMHTVIASECTGCELCLPPCPVDCIRMQPIPQEIRTWKWPFPGDTGRDIGASAAA